jgi:hypothetical protein
MQTLLSLPRELRDTIIEEVLLSRVEPPQSPAADPTPRTDVSLVCGLRLPILLPQAQFSAYGLLLTNKQLRIETKGRMFQLPLSYALDVMLVGDDNYHDELWPTWLCCPSRGFKTIDIVEITIRNFSTDKVPYLVRLDAICGFADFRASAKYGISSLCDLLDYIVSVCTPRSQVPSHSIGPIKINVEVPPAFDVFPEKVDAAKMAALWDVYLGDEYFLRSEILSSAFGSKDYRRDNFPMSLRLLAYRLIAAIESQKDWQAGPRPFGVTGNEIGVMASLRGTKCLTCWVGPTATVILVSDD